MPREPSPEEVRRLRKEGYCDAGTTYLQLGVAKPPTYRLWDG